MGSELVSIKSKRPVYLKKVKVAANLDRSVTRMMNEYACHGPTVVCADIAGIGIKQILARLHVT